MSEAWNLVLVHWPFIAWMVVASIVGKVMVGNVFTKARATTKGKLRLLWLWGRRTLPLHPMLAGLVLGLAWQSPEPAVSGGLPSMAYFAVSGALSLWLFELVTRLPGMRGLKLELPGQSVPPKP